MGSLKGALDRQHRRRHDRQFRQSAGSGAVVFHVVRADGDRARHQADGTLWPRLATVRSAGADLQVRSHRLKIAVLVRRAPRLHRRARLRQLVLGRPADADVLIFAMLAMSLDILLGYTGLPSLGHAGIFGVAAYAVAVLSTRYGAGFWTCVVGGILVGHAAERRVRPARLPRARRLLPDDHAGPGHGAVGPELPLDSGDRRRQRHLRHPAPRRACRAAVRRARSPSTT